MPVAQADSIIGVRTGNRVFSAADNEVMTIRTTRARVAVAVVAALALALFAPLVPSADEHHVDLADAVSLCVALSGVAAVIAGIGRIAGPIRLTSRVVPIPIGRPALLDSPAVPLISAREGPAALLQVFRN